ncbi:MAG: hypothetical protein ACR2PH_17550, partial [Desulfobulbia bacterium]
MEALRTVFGRYVSVLFVAATTCVSTPIETIAEQPSKPVGEDGFHPSADQDTISLKVTNATLKAILDQIGDDPNIQVDAQVADDETVTDELQTLPLDHVLRRLVPNRAFISDKSSGKITKIVIMREGVAGQETPTEMKVAQMAISNGASTDENWLAELFKFEFDPSAVILKSREEE